MIKVMFICHGNICRSPMAEFVFKDMVKSKGLESEIFIASSATSTEEIHSKVHCGTRNKLSEYGISTDGKCAVQLKKSDYDKYDYLIGMDDRNIINIHSIVGEDRENKIYKLLDFSQRKGDIADPWYTGKFDVTYDDIYEGCEDLFKFIIDNNSDKM